MKEISWEEIRELQRNERNSETLQKVDDDIFERLKSYINEREKIIEEGEKEGSEIGKEMAKRAEMELRKAKGLIDDFMASREKKIMKNAIRSVMSDFEDTTNMTKEEERLYRGVIRLLKNFKEDIFKNEDKGEIKKENKNLMLIRFIKDVPKFLFEDKEYGPFKEEDMTNLPKKVGEILINAKKAVIVGDKDENAKGSE